MEIWTSLNTLTQNPWAVTGLALLIYVIGYWHGKGMPEFLTKPKKRDNDESSR